jgi:alpha-D-ribose 1-methylphosphonate 5-triphosphate synthase subunit PhnH
MTPHAHTDFAFADAVHDAQRVFRSAMQALARPGSVHLLTGLPPAPAPLTAAANALILALADHETPLWLDAPLASTQVVLDHLRFQTSARIVASAHDASFAIVADPSTCPALDDLSLGSLEYPDRSTTLILQVEHIETGRGWRLTGPGIVGETRLLVEPTPRHLLSMLAESRALFPRGIDVLLAASGTIAALPRTTRLTQ